MLDVIIPSCTNFKFILTAVEVKGWINNNTPSVNMDVTICPFPGPNAGLALVKEPLVVF